MASIIPGYEYDIFISYRQKDNKYDGWVTEFVDNLKRELEATFKEEVSVYFDINPHDGLLETHDVDASLKEKLKCLIFIPIISQTYCDPGSFAWRHEFKEFTELASNDQFGLKIKLPGGNITSRVLPVQIHELDTNDKALIDKELGSILRAIEFIYREAGVNRPLRSNEENPSRNLNQTIYRNQVNKVANAVKNIITGIRYPSKSPSQESDSEFTHRKRSASTKRNLLLVPGFILLLSLAGYFLFMRRLSSPPSDDNMEKSIAVLPFADMSPGHDQEYLGDGLADDIISALSGIHGLKVIGRTSSFQFKGSKVDLRDVGKKLDVTTVLEGSVQKSSGKIRVTVQLIDVKDGSQIWSEKWDKEMSDVFSIQDEISSAITEKLKITFLDRPINAIRQSNPDAYEAFLLGKYYLFKSTSEPVMKAKGYFEKAIQLDPDYADAYAFLSFTFSRLGEDIYPPIDSLKRHMAMDSSRMFAEKAIFIDDQNSLAHIAISKGYLNSYDWINAEKEFRKALQLNPGALEKTYLASFLTIFGQFDEAERLAKEAIKIDPLETTPLFVYSDIFMTSKKYDEALVQIKKALDIDPNSAIAYANLGHYYVAKKEYQNAILAWSRQQQLSGDSVLADIYRKSDFKTAMIAWIERTRTMDAPLFADNIGIAFIYATLDDRENAIKYLQLAYTAHSTQITWLRCNPAFDSIRDDPRIIELYEKAGFKAYDEYKAALKK